VLKLISVLSGLVVLVFVLLLAVGFAGALHPAGDSLAVFRWQIALALTFWSTVLCLTLTRRRLLPLTLALAGALCALPITLNSFASTSSLRTGLILYQKNMSFRMPDTTPLARDIAASGADIITLQEVDTDNRSLLATLAETHPTQVLCPFSFVGAVAIATRLPVTDTPPVCLEGQGMAAIEVETETGPLWLVSIHLHWPWPHGQPQQIDRLESRIKVLEGDVLVAGDFNMVPWSHSMKRIRKAAGAKQAGASLYTFPLAGGVLSLPIDHVLTPATSDAETSLRPFLGSDHRGVLARISYPGN